MKKKLLIILVSVLILAIGFLAAFWGYVRTEDGVRQNSRVKICVTEPVTSDQITIRFTIRNSSIRKYWYDDKHSDNLFLDRKVDGVWEQMEEKLLRREDLGSYKSPCPAFGKSKEVTLRVQYWTLQGGLAPGEYRIRQRMYRSNFEDAGFFAVATFTVAAD